MKTWEGCEGEELGDSWGKKRGDEGKEELSEPI